MAKRNVKLVEEIKLNHFRTLFFFSLFSIFFYFLKCQERNQNILSVNCSVYHPALPGRGRWRSGKTLAHGSALLAASYLIAMLQSLRLCLKILSHAISLLMA